MTKPPQRTSCPVPEAERTWWKESVVYQIYPRSFADSDGDGIGDIPGIIDRLDHVADLGADAIWLNPVYESPQHDNGYDISDYRSIHHEYGTMGDWEELLAQVHERDMRLVMDLVVNHTSVDHEWFQRSRRRDPDYEDYYIWREGEDGEVPNNWESFFGGSAWTYDEERGKYYLHLYDESQPDLNWRNPAVRRDIFDTMEWWLEKGIDGFRLDVINLLSKAAGLPDGDPDAEWTGARHFVDGPRLLAYLEAMDEQVLSNYDAMTVGEMPQLSVEQARKYAGTDGPLDMAFHFQHTKLDYEDGKRWSVGDWDLPELKQITRRWHDGLSAEGWNALFWENHDQPRVVSRYGDPETYHRESATMLGTFMLTRSGTPYVYQGQELGMTNAQWADVESLADVDARRATRELLDSGQYDSFEEVADIVGYRSRDNARTPMQWDDSDHAGFTDGEPWLPVNTNYREVNVAAQADDSVTAYYRSLIELRAEHDAFVYGTYEDLHPEHERLAAYTQTLEYPDGGVSERMLAVLNFSADREPVELPTTVEDADLLLSNYDRDAIAPMTAHEPYEARVFRLE